MNRRSFLTNFASSQSAIPAASLGPKFFTNAVLRTQDNKEVKFYDDVIKVRGQFHCSEEKQDGYLVSLYRIDADSVVAQ